METFDLIVNGATYHIVPVEEGDGVAYTTTIQVTFRPDNGHLRADPCDDLLDGIAHAIESNFL